jgi:hypothetical protein
MPTYYVKQKKRTPRWTHLGPVTTDQIIGEIKVCNGVISAEHLAETRCSCISDSIRTDGEVDLQSTRYDARV